MYRMKLLGATVKAGDFGFQNPQRRHERSHARLGDQCGRHLYIIGTAAGPIPTRSWCGISNPSLAAKPAPSVYRKPVACRMPQVACGWRFQRHWPVPSLLKRQQRGHVRR